MKNILSLKNVLILTIFIFSLCSSLLAFGEKIPVKNAIGSVTAVSANQLVVNEYNLDTGEYNDRVYLFDSKTDLKNVKTINDISPNDNVEISYIEKAGKNIAQKIVVEKLSADEKMIEESKHGYVPEEYTPNELSSNETVIP